LPVGRGEEGRERERKKGERSFVVIGREEYAPLSLSFRFKTHEGIAKDISNKVQI